MNTKWQHFVCVCVWFQFTGWEQCGTGALSSCQAGAQEINVYYLGKKRNKITTSPLICSIIWCLLWLRASPPARPLTSAVPGSDAAPWSNPRRIALPADEVALQAVMQTAWASRGFSASPSPLGMLLSLPCPSASPESPEHLTFSAALFKKPHHFP